SVAILRLRGGGIVFVPATEEERRHLISRRHLTKIDRILVDPDESAGRSSDHCFGFAFSDANSDTIRQHTADDCGAYPRQPLKMLAECGEIRAPNSGLTN